MKEQTAVEWLYDQLTSTWFDKASGTDILKRAKEMEEGQIAVAYSTGTLDGVNKDFTNGYTYYQKTYKKNA
jgi:hypothetical protein